MNSTMARVTTYSHWSVTARWQDGARQLEATLGHGFPFAYFKVTGGNASVALGGGAVIWHRQNETIGVSVGGRPYAIFAPTGATWTGTGPLISTLAGRDYLSVAALPDTNSATLAFFKRYAYSHIVSTAVTWQYQEATARLNATFSAVTTAKEGAETGTLFALFRHQWLDVTSPLTAFTYPSARGLMRVAAGPSFTTSSVFNGVLPAMPHMGSDATTLNNELNAVSGNAAGGDSYAAGKALGKVAAVSFIAQLAGNTAKRNEFINGLKAELESWFTAGGPKQFYYHAPWNTLIGYPPAYGSDTRLSDHHFHYGYFLMAAAAVAQADPTWASAQNWGGMVEMLIRELVGWQETDPLFGRFRYFDPYEGHGWADGMGFDRGNNQESSSESMNANAGIILWGIHTGNTALRDLGIFMYTQEARAIEQYWWDVDNVNFPAAFTSNCVGIVWSNGGAYATWFSAAAEKIRGINFLPITAGHIYLGRNPAFVTQNFNAGYQVGATDWSGIFNEYLAFADPDRAVANYGGGMNMEGGETRAHTYHHLRSLQAVGQLNVQVTANTPSYAVFDKAATRAYTAYNPNNTALTVTFNDGFSMSVPAKTQLTRTGPVLPVYVIRKRMAAPPRARLGLFDVLGRYFRR
jgi:endoglucanase Acf2